MLSGPLCNLVNMAFNFGYGLQVLSLCATFQQGTRCLNMTLTQGFLEQCTNDFAGLRYGVMKGKEIFDKSTVSVFLPKYY